MSKFNGSLMTGMAWRNLWRQKRRTIITIFSMSVGLALCVPTYGLMDGLAAEMIKGITSVHLGTIEIHNPQYPKQRQLKYSMPFESTQKKISKVSGITGIAPRVYTGGMISSEHSVKVLLKALPAKNSLMLSKGKPLSDKKKCSALVDTSFAKKLRISTGTVLRIKNNTYEKSCEKIYVTGIYKQKSPNTPHVVYMNKLDAGLILYGYQIQNKNLNKLPSEEDDNDDDIDNLPKLSDNNPPPKTEIPSNLPQSGECTLVRSVSNQIGIVGISPQNEKKVTQIHSNLTSGDYLSDKYQPNTQNKTVKEILIGSKLAEILMVKTGDVIGMDLMTAYGYPLDDLFVIKGIFKTGLDSMDRSLVYIHIKNAWDKSFMNLKTTFNGKKVNAIHEFALKTVPNADLNAISSNLKNILGKKYMVRTWTEIEPSLAQMVKMQNAMTGIILLIIFIIAALGTMNTMLMSVFERTKEFGVLKAIGMKPYQVAYLIITETFIMTMVAAALGAGIGHTANWYFQKYGLDLSGMLPEGFTYQGVFISPIWKSLVSVQSVILPIIVLCTVSIIVSIWPAIRAAKISPVKAFREQGI